MSMDLKHSASQFDLGAADQGLINNHECAAPPDNPTNHLLLEVELHMRSSSNKRELNVYGPPPINLE
ncbi:hypothetical protein L208DRAFT_1406959 [Tricholoma matsutake]|nr:hypothetical protein L208DRAFT_1406959 [Tricholoma matsutake 945]